MSETSSTQRCVIVIPARYASTRLPGKPLADILGKPMIQHVYERAQQVQNVDVVVVATDDARVMAAVEAFGGQAVMTSAEHSSGTDRLVEVMQRFPAAIYINLQGDEPLVRAADVQRLVDGMRQQPEIRVGTLCHPVGAREAQNPNCVKVVLDAGGRALYFSRAPIPFPRDGERARYLKHVGVYGYRAEVLAQYSALDKSMPEQAEVLEQLRLMHAGISIYAFEVEPTGPGVDTPACLEQVRRLLSGETAEEARLDKVKLVITDVDGVLTDGSIYYDATGECLKRFHVRDGLGIRMLEEAGIRVAVLSGRDSATLRKRIADLGISASRLGVKDKAEACRALMAECGALPHETVCTGDDSIDLPAFRTCGLSFAVADAPDYVKRQASGVLTLPGGHGAFRELSDRILEAKGLVHIATTADGFERSMTTVAQ
ncbi:3-deoxy-manno-octulosonate cytidylyltransferase [Imbroritus primus]|uniref:3-deoxy-manno-octulosonate cytidylyltransferase n=1 Tax=Imbroritus primus TaxID=3058603 RepID=UPI003D160C14